MLPPIYKNGTYQITVVKEPDGKYECYGVQNRSTNVIEAYISQLARAIQIADVFEHELKHGMHSQSAEKELENAIISALAMKPPTQGGSGKAN